MDNCSSSEEEWKVDSSDNDCFVKRDFFWMTHLLINYGKLGSEFDVSSHNKARLLGLHKFAILTRLQSTTLFQLIEHNFVT